MNTSSINDQDWDQLWSKAHRHLAGIPYLRERTELRHLSHLLRNVKSFVDVGASYGPYTWVAHYALNECDICCIEANPTFAGHIEKEWARVVENEESRGNSIRVINHPVSNEETELLFHLDPVLPFHSYIVGTKDEGSERGDENHLTLKTVVLDRLFTDTTPDLIKIDIEGAEWRALDGCRKLVGKRATRFLLEIHPWGDASIDKRPSDIFKFFRSQSYTVERINTHWHFKPVAPSLVNRLMSHAYGFVLDRPSVKLMLKRLLKIKA